ncbi:LarC family nickel insertion protein [Alkalihalobacillus deserti]|uniref:LarC family nickel insertion protein n=1 Tax=Alkalihalobacillus deserti TaxID=2879466 RepID=UPI00223CD6A5|nr:LarC family nickel insertion protein [Alkalihalobacillus deserti]
MKILYLDCFSGISGDMMIGALLDAGADPFKLEAELTKLHITEEYKLKWTKVVKNGITSTKFDVLLNNEELGHSHAHGHSHDDEHSHTHGHSHDDEHSHAHEHSHDHEDSHAHEHSHDHGHSHAHGHHHRSYKDIVKLIEAAGFSDRVKDTSLNIFRKIGEAEGHIHNLPLEDVHFHEVGAVDSIIDIVGAAILLDQLEIDVIRSSPIPVGNGKIRIDHGVYPVPAPATLEMLKGVPIAQSELKAELTTPTGAAIVVVLAEEFCAFPAMKIKQVGYGAGTKSFRDHPNVLRVIIGE